MTPCLTRSHHSDSLLPPSLASSIVSLQQGGHLAPVVLEAVDVEVDRAVDDGQQVRHVGHTVDPDWPVKVGLL